MLAHNVETIKRLTEHVRDRRAGYERSLAVLKMFKEMDPGLFTKSSIMVGLGETFEEVVETMKDLREVGVDILTIGQYLRPTSEKRHLPVERYYTPEEFKRFEEIGLKLGFGHIASGPLVRSSYKAAEFFVEYSTRRKKASLP